ncbi:MAG: Ppx/GppA phosphatase family protein [bacterium]|nr:Ppx/GppA phosphatase family protein [bacterium]
MATGKPNNKVADVALAQPARVAAIDIGSNALRFMAAARTHALAFSVLASERVAVRLGASVFAHGAIAAEALDAACVALLGFCRHMQQLNIETYRAVATSAVRDSSNAAHLIARAHAEAGITVEIIDPAEEARLVYRAVAQAVPLGETTWALVDLGGGSVQLALLDAHTLRWSASRTLGAVRLLEQTRNQQERARQWDAYVADAVRTLDSVLAPLRDHAHGLIAVGGGIEVLAGLAGAPPHAGAPLHLGAAALHELRAKLAGLLPDQVQQRFNVAPDRADILGPAALVYDYIAQQLGVTELIVPRVGVREGIIADLLQGAPGASAFTASDDALYQAALRVGRAHAFEEGHARQVTRLALQLFDQLHLLHQLGHADRRIMLVAGLLHDIGQSVSYDDHHKHSLLLIEQTALPGMTGNELTMAANVARYHRKKTPREKHAAFADLSPHDRERVKKLAALLRIADGLDRRHCDAVRSVQVLLQNGQALLRAEGMDGLELEQTVLSKKADLFEDVYGLRLRLEPVAARH